MVKIKQILMSVYEIIPILIQWNDINGFSLNILGVDTGTFNRSLLYFAFSRDYLEIELLFMKIKNA